MLTLTNPTIDTEKLFKATNRAMRHGDAEQVGADLVAVAPSLERFSLRNRLMLVIQAHMRGMALSDVDTPAGWRKRGRQVRANEIANPFVLVVQMTPAGKEQAGAKRTYRVVGQWFDVSQTEPSA